MIEGQADQQLYASFKLEIARHDSLINHLVNGLIKYFPNRIYYICKRSSTSEQAIVCFRGSRFKTKHTCFQSYLPMVEKILNNTTP